MDGNEDKWKDKLTWRKTDDSRQTQTDTRTEGQTDTHWKYPSCTDIQKGERYDNYQFTKFYPV